MKNDKDKPSKSKGNKKGKIVHPYHSMVVITNPRIDHLNAKAAGLFTDNDVIELDQRIAREGQKKIAESKRKVVTKPFKRITVRNATREDVVNALHKVHVKG